MSADFALVTGPIRPDATPVHVYSDGLAVFLYDASREKEIRRKDPAILYGCGSDTARDAATRALLGAGALLVYGLHDDGGVHAEVVVGAAPGDGERAGAAWLESDAGYLDLPTGRLCVHSYDTLPMGDNGPRPEERGAAVEVAPGRYRVRVFRKDWHGMAAAGHDWVARAEEAGVDTERRVDDVVVLEPLGEGEPSPVPVNVLFPECIGWEEPPPEDHGEVRDGVWHGRIVQSGEGPAPSIALNLGRATAGALGLAWGDRLEIAAGGERLDAFHHGELRHAAAYRQAAGEEGRRALAGGTGVEAFLGHRDVPAAAKVEGFTEWLRVSAAGEVPALFALPAGTPATLRRADEPFARAEIAPARFRKGEITAQVVWSRPDWLMVGIGYALLRKLKIGVDERLEMEFAGGERLQVIKEVYPDSPAWKQAERGARPMIATFRYVSYWAADDESFMVLRSPLAPLLARPGESTGPALPVFPVGTPLVLRRPDAG